MSVNFYISSSQNLVFGIFSPSGTDQDHFPLFYYIKLTVVIILLHPGVTIQRTGLSKSF